LENQGGKVELLGFADGMAPLIASDTLAVKTDTAESTEFSLRTHDKSQLDQVL
jgi:hypothetical protein